MSVPALVLVVPLEGAPRLHFDALDDRERLRLDDWLTTSPMLVRAAAELVGLFERLDDERDGEVAE